MVTKSRTRAMIPWRILFWLSASSLLTPGVVGAPPGQSPSTRRAVIQDGPHRDPESTALLEPIIAHHARLARSEPASAEHYRKFADRLMIKAVKSLGLAAKYYGDSLIRSQPLDGIAMPDQVAARGHLDSARVLFRAARSNLRDAEWHDRRARYHRAAVDYYERLLASGVTKLPPLGPELVEARRELERAYSKLYGGKAALPPEPLRELLPGYAPVAPPDEDPHRSNVRDGSF